MASNARRNTGRSNNPHAHRNPALHHATIERARSNAGTPHDPRPRRTRTRSTQRRGALADFL